MGACWVDDVGFFKFVLTAAKGVGTCRTCFFFHTMRPTRNKLPATATLATAAAIFATGMLMVGLAGVGSGSEAIDIFSGSAMGGRIMGWIIGMDAGLVS